MYIHFLKNQESFANKLSKKNSKPVSCRSFVTGVVISRLFNLSYTLLRSGHQALLLVMMKRVDSTSKRLNHIFNKSIENID